MARSSITAQLKIWNNGNKNIYMRIDTHAKCGLKNKGDETMNNLKQLCAEAYRNQSFSPEKLADRMYSDLTEELKADLKNLENPGNYESKYIAHASKYLSRKARVMNWFITGPANFPVARNQKNMDLEDKAWKEFRAWRSRYFKAVNRIPHLSPEQDLDKALIDLNKTTQFQEMAKAANKIIRDKKDGKKERLFDLGFSEKSVNTLMTPDCFGNLGIASFTLTNNRSKIKRLESKVIIMKNRIERKTDFQPVSFPGGVINIENDRVTITHDEKPERSVIDRIKARGFRWSRNFNCWSRKHTAQALYDAKEIVGI